jgi:hypothetical protein
MPEKRVRPRPNQITVNLDESTRGKFDEILAKFRASPKGGAFFSHAQLLKEWIDATHDELFPKKNKNNSRN